MASVEELELAAKQGEVVDEFEGEGGEEILIEDDMREALSLLRKCMYLLDYAGDRDLLKAISQRERLVMRGLAETVREFLDDASQHYDDDGEF